MVCKTELLVFSRDGLISDHLGNLQVVVARASYVARNLVEGGLAPAPHSDELPCWLGLAATTCTAVESLMLCSCAVESLKLPSSS